MREPEAGHQVRGRPGRDSAAISTRPPHTGDDLEPVPSRHGESRTGRGGGAATLRRIGRRRLTELPRIEHHAGAVDYLSARDERSLVALEADVVQARLDRQFHRSPPRLVQLDDEILA